MSLTVGGGPLAAAPNGETNYTIDGPKSRILFTPFPRRLRALVGDAVIVDTDGAHLLYETNLLPVAYLPRDDVDFDLLRPTARTTHCPYKGDAVYWSITVNDEIRLNAVWGYPDPKPEAAWLADYVAIYWEQIDRWLDEDTEVRGHLTDPYHRVDIRRSSRPVDVMIGASLVARSSEALVVSETGLPNRYYLPPGDVDHSLLVPSETVTYCPYKGETVYRSFLADPNGDTVADVGWSYPNPLAESAALAGYWSFLGDKVVHRIGRAS